MSVFSVIVGTAFVVAMPSTMACSLLFSSETDPEAENHASAIDLDSGEPCVAVRPSPIARWRAEGNADDFHDAHHECAGTCGGNSQAHWELSLNKDRRIQFAFSDSSPGGLLDEVAYYDDALTEQEIQQLFNQPNCPR